LRRPLRSVKLEYRPANEPDVTKLLESANVLLKDGTESMDDPSEHALVLKAFAAVIIASNTDAHGRQEA
jgi:hypothetical protein